jgi:hypothetical protein
VTFVPPEDFFDEDWEEPSKTQDTAAARSSGGTPPTGPDAPDQPPTGRSRPRLRTGGSGGSGGRPPRSRQSLEYGRLALLGGGIVLVLLVGWLLVSQFGGSSVPASQKYFNALGPIVKSSNAAGVEFHQLMLRPETPVTKFKDGLNSQLTQSQAAVTNAGALKPPKQLAPVQPFLLQALQYRVNGLTCLLKNADAAYAAKTQVGAGAAMAACTQKLLASDVIYADSFSGAATAILKADNTVAQPPTSRFLAQSDTNLVLATGFGEAIQRLSKPPTGLHGTEIGRITAQPSGKVLEGAGPTQVQESSDLSFQVNVINKGNFEEVQIPVDFVMTHPGAKTIKKTEIIAQIAAHKKAHVSFTDIFDSSNIPQYNQPYTITVTVHKVPGEVRLDNNHTTTKVTFLAPK